MRKCFTSNTWNRKGAVQENVLGFVLRSQNQPVVSVNRNSFSARKATSTTFQEYKKRFSNIASRLENHLRKIISRLASLTLANSRINKGIEGVRI